MRYGNSLLRTPTINRNNPLTRGLVLSVPCSSPSVANSTTATPELVFKHLGNSGAGTGRPVPVTQLIGNMLSFNGANPGPVVDVALVAQQRSLSKFTICFFANRQGAAPADNGRMFCITDGTTTGMNFIDIDNVANQQFNVNFSTTRGVWTTATNTATVLNFWIITYDGTSVSNVPGIWLNGLPLSVTTTTAPVGTQTFNDTDFLIGNLNQAGNAFTRTYNGYLGFYNMWNRILTNKEIISLTANPFQIYGINQNRIANLAQTVASSSFFHMLLMGVG